MTRTALDRNIGDFASQYGLSRDHLEKNFISADSDEKYQQLAKYLNDGGTALVYTSCYEKWEGKVKNGIFFSDNQSGPSIRNVTMWWKLHPTET